MMHTFCLGWRQRHAATKVKRWRREASILVTLWCGGSVKFQSTKRGGRASARSKGLVVAPSDGFDRRRHLTFFRRAIVQQLVVVTGIIWMMAVLDHVQSVWMERHPDEGYEAVGGYKDT